MKKILKEVREFYKTSNCDSTFYDCTMRFLQLKSEESDESVSKRGIFGKQREALKLLLSKNNSAKSN